MHAVMLPFDEEDLYLPIKTVAEYFYCQRAAFYMFMRWENDTESVYFYKGSQQHHAIERLPYKHRPGAKISYRYFVVSRTLRVYGFCDAVEITPSCLYPVEYKTGRVRSNVMHRVQLFLQAACLEKMHGIKVSYGYIYFVESRKRLKVEFTEHEKRLVMDKLSELRTKLRNPRIQDFTPCGSQFCSYHAIDDPLVYLGMR